jgi:hypothetical protein
VGEAGEKLQRDGYKQGAAYANNVTDDSITIEQRGRFKIAFWKCFALLARAAGYGTAESMPYQQLHVALTSHFGEKIGGDVHCAIERAFVERDELKEKVKQLEAERTEWLESHRMITAGTQRI